VKIEGMSIMGMHLSRLVLVVVASHALACSADIHYVSKTGSNEFPHTSPRTAARSIQDAVDAAEYGDIVDVAPGEYVQQVTLKDGIILWGWGGDATVIRQPKAAIYAVGGAEDVQIRDLSVAAPAGDPLRPRPFWPPGISLGPHGNQLVIDCALSGKFQAAIQCEGQTPGSPIIIKRTVIEGACQGVLLSHAVCAIDACVVRDCAIGVRAQDSELSMARTTLQQSGARLEGSRAKIYNCAFVGRGIGGWAYDLSLCNSLVCGDYAGISTDYFTTLRVLNCTVTANELGIFVAAWADIWVQNSIVWGNGPGSSPNGGAGIQIEGGHVTVRYSDVQGPFPTHSDGQPSAVWPGDGNIAADPLFRDAQNLDFTLTPGSPCIDSCPNFWPCLGGCYGCEFTFTAPFVDLDGGPRGLYGGGAQRWDSPAIDMGAYEFSLSMIEPAEGGAMTLTWSSVSGRTYSVYYSDDLLNWHLAQPNVLSEGDWTTSWTDAEGSGTPLPPWQAPLRFYRAVENVEGSQPW